MDIQNLTGFLMWCTILNFVLMTPSFLICVFAGDVAYRMHCTWSPMPREAFNVMLHSFIGFYKFMFFFFNVIPLVALLLVT